MLTGRHLYFAYGSNLCVRQMSVRCPDASDPRPAVLSDHDWLINERGVATVEPLTGGQVHGVLWQISDRDLATLDSAEGLPVRYRRDLLCVRTHDGPTTAWVYIDHRITPGPPRPEYLNRVIDGALHHGLPQRWIDFLHRWDPVHWLQPVSAAASGAGPQSLSALLSEPGLSEISQLRSRFGFLAIYGGGARVDYLEHMTAYVKQHHPTVPILIAGNGNRVMTLAAQQANIVGLTGSNVHGADDPLAERVDFVRRAAGDRFDALELNLAITALPNEGETAPDLAMTRRYAPELSDEQILALHSVLGGSPREIADTLAGYRDIYGVTSFTVQDNHLDNFAKVIAELR